MYCVGTFQIVRDGLLLQAQRRIALVRFLQRLRYIFTGALIISIFYWDMIDPRLKFAEKKGEGAIKNYESVGKTIRVKYIPVNSPFH